MAPTAAQVESVRALVRESVAAVDALAPSALHALIPALRTARDELRRDLSAWLATVDGADRFGAYQKQQVLRAMEAALDRVSELEPAMAGALKKARHLTGPLAVTNLDHEIQRLGALFGGGIPAMPQISTAAVIAKGDKLLWRQHATSAKRYAGAIGDDIRQMFAVGVAKGETFEQLVTRLRRIRNPGARTKEIDSGADASDIADSLIGRYRWWGERLVRTEMMHAYNVQHDEAVEQANDQRPEGDEEYLRRWDAAADVRVCPLCRALDGRVTTIKGTFPGGISSPPRHPCCRCVVLAWMRRWGDMPGETGASGDVPQTDKRKIETADKKADKKTAGTKPESKKLPKKPEPADKPPKKSKPKSEQKALPPVPTVREAERVAPEAKRFLEAVSRGDFTSAVQHLDEAYERRGWGRAQTVNGNVRVSDDGLRVKTHSGREIVALGVRHWDGNIQVSEDTGRLIKKYAEIFSSGHKPDDMLAAHNEHFNELASYRAKNKARLPKKKDAVLSGDVTAEGIRNIQFGKAHSDAINTLVHEGLHGWSPGAPSSYRHHGGIVEEVTNETATRMVVTDMFGTKQIWRGGSYDRDISAVMDAIGEITGSSDRDEQWGHLQRATDHYKSRRSKLKTPDDVVAAFANDIAAATKTKPDQSEATLRKHLDAFAKSQSGGAH